MVWKPALSEKTGEENIPSAEGKVGSRARRVALASLLQGRASDQAIRLPRGRSMYLSGHWEIVSAMVKGYLLLSVAKVSLGRLRGQLLYMIERSSGHTLSSCVSPSNFSAHPA